VCELLSSLKYSIGVSQNGQRHLSNIIQDFGSEFQIKLTVCQK
jgi:hypothetical protein